MMPSRQQRVRMGVICVAAGAGLALQRDARADDTVTTKVTIVRASTVDTADRTTDAHEATIKVHGDKVRIDYTGATIIYDSQARKVYFLNTDKKTYTVSPTTGEPAGNGSNGAQQGPKPEVTTDAEKTGDTRTVNSIGTHRYSITASVQSARQSGGGGGGGFGGYGRHRRGGGGGGGNPGGSGDGSGAGAGRRMTPIIVEGDYWLTDSLSTPLSDVARKQVIAASVLVTMPRSRAALELAQSIAGQVLKGKSYPLASRLTLLPPMRSFVGSNDSTPAGSSETIEVTTEVESITAGPLDDTLFTIPSDYLEMAQGAP